MAIFSSGIAASVDSTQEDTSHNDICIESFDDFSEKEWICMDIWWNGIKKGLR